MGLWQITAYDKDGGVYDVLETGPFDELGRKLGMLQKQCEEETLRRSNGEPYDFVFMEPEGSDGSGPVIYAEGRKGDRNENKEV